MPKGRSNTNLRKGKHPFSKEEEEDDDYEPTGQPKNPTLSPRSTRTTRQTSRTSESPNFHGWNSDEVQSSSMAPAYSNLLNSLISSENISDVIDSVDVEDSIRDVNEPALWSCGLSYCQILNELLAIMW